MKSDTVRLVCALGVLLSTPTPSSGATPSLQSEGGSTLPLESPPPRRGKKVDAFDIGSRRDQSIEDPAEDKAEERALHRMQRAWMIGLRAFGDWGLSAPMVAGLRISAEVGYRLPFARRLVGISLEPAFVASWSRGTLPTGQVLAQSFGVSVPLLISANVIAGPGIFRVAAGPSFEWSKFNAALDGFSTDAQALGLGATGGVSYGLCIGLGLLTAEARYSLRPERFIGNQHLRHGVLLGVGYVFLL